MNGPVACCRIDHPACFKKYVCIIFFAQFSFVLKITLPILGRSRVGNLEGPTATATGGNSECRTEIFLQIFIAPVPDMPCNKNEHNHDQCELLTSKQEGLFFVAWFLEIESPVHSQD